MVLASLVVWIESTVMVLQEEVRREGGGREGKGREGRIGNCVEMGRVWIVYASGDGSVYGEWE